MTVRIADVAERLTVLVPRPLDEFLDFSMAPTTPIPIIRERAFTSIARESEHQPRLVGYPVGVKLGHLVEQLFVGRRGFLQPIKVQQIALSVLNRRRRVRRTRLLVTGNNNRRLER